MALLTITKDNFDSEVMKSDVPVLIDFWAEWCGPCRMMAPVIHEIADERTDIKVGKIDVDAEPELAAAFRIESIPTLAVLKNGAVTAASVGVRPKADVLALLDK
ncbi:MAG: thioredoxin [Eubacteriales bacterium]|nr:thioredoxin [Clostridiales bacterium]